MFAKEEEKDFLQRLKIVLRKHLSEEDLTILAISGIARGVQHLGKDLDIAAFLRMTADVSEMVEAEDKAKDKPK